MSKPLDPTALPDDIARLAEAQVRAGRFESVEDVLRAGIEAVAEDERDAARADAVAWRNYQARRPADPRDLTAAEASACLNSDDPARHDVLRAHLDAGRKTFCDAPPVARSARTAASAAASRDVSPLGLNRVAWGARHSATRRRSRGARAPAASAAASRDVRL